MTFAPRRTGKPVEEITLTGKLVPFRNGQPIMLNFTMSPHTYLPCFDTESELREMMADIGWDNIKHVDDGQEFLVSIPPHVVVITKLRKTERGTFKFLQVFRD